jgi:DNA-binding NarL/FixJ family response regulator
MIRIFLADDHAIVRHGLRKLIEDCADMTIVGEAADGRRVLNATEQEKASWDVLVLDLSLPRVNGIEVLRRLKQERPAMKIVILSMYPEDQYAARMESEGAAAYLSKDRPPEEVLKIIRQVSTGLPYRRKDLPKEEAAPAHASLSAREYQVFTLLFQGQTVTDIAVELNLSTSTVSNHVAKIKEKLGARSIGEIVGYAHRAGLVA